MLLDIITISKNNLEGILLTIESTKPLREQGAARQIIIDGSDSKTSHQIQDAIHGEKHVSYIFQQPSGISAAFNLGLDHSDAQWVWFLNCGDAIHPAMTPALLLDILRTSSADAIVFQIEKRQSHFTPPHPPMSELWPTVSSWVPHPATILRRRLFTTYGRFREEYTIAMDYEMWLRLFSKDVVVDLISMPIAMYDEGGISSTNKRDASREILRILMVHGITLLKGLLYNVWMILRTVGLRIFRSFQLY